MGPQGKSYNGRNILDKSLTRHSKSMFYGYVIRFIVYIQTYTSNNTFGITFSLVIIVYRELIDVVLDVSVVIWRYIKGTWALFRYRGHGDLSFLKGQEAGPENGYEEGPGGCETLRRLALCHNI